MSQNARATLRQIDWLLRLWEEARAVVAGHQPLDAHLAALFRTHREFGSRDRRLFSEALFAGFRWQGALDAAGVDDPATRLALAWLMDEQPATPAMDHLIAALPDAPARLAALRALPADVLVPPWFRAALLTPAGADEPAHFERVVRSLQRRPPTWVRARPGRRDEVLRRLAEAGGEPFFHPHQRDAIGLGRQVPLEVIHRTSGAAFEVQDVASQSVVPAGGPRPGETWWDVCAGAGGKTLQLADRLGLHGQLMATDVRTSALEELARRLQAARIRMVEIDRFPPHRTTAGLFDGVLVDAPCSGLGTWSRNPDARWRTPSTWIADKAEVQRRLLDQVARAVRVGGRLVYAVCTITRTETTDVVQHFLATHPDFAPADPPQPWPPGAPPGPLLLWPGDGPGDGMFAAVFVRRGTPDT